MAEGISDSSGLCSLACFLQTRSRVQKPFFWTRSPRNFNKHQATRTSQLLLLSQKAARSSTFKAFKALLLLPISLTTDFSSPTAVPAPSVFNFIEPASHKSSTRVLAQLSSIHLQTSTHLHIKYSHNVFLHLRFAPFHPCLRLLQHQRGCRRPRLCRMPVGPCLGYTRGKCLQGPGAIH